ncbi:MAG: hypothetical protein V2A76_00970 [Planctomycetota bacterium]
MRARARPLPLLAIALLPACSLMPAEEVRFTRADLVHVFQEWREAERRRDVDLAEQVIEFQSGADRIFLENEFRLLAPLPAGPVVSDVEIHLVGYPDDFGPGDYLFLEPVGRSYISSRARIASRDGKPVIVYERLGSTVEEQSRLSPEALRRTVLERQIAHWKSLDDDLEAEVNRMLTTLRYRQAAAEYAKEQRIPLTPFDPDPGLLLVEYSRLTPEEVRDAVILALSSSLVTTPRSP